MNILCKLGGMSGAGAEGLPTLPNWRAKQARINTVLNQKNSLSLALLEVLLLLKTERTFYSC